MKSRIAKIWSFLKSKWKWSLAVLILVLIVVPRLLPNGFDPKKEIVETVKAQDLKKTVRATGEVTSIVDLELGFNGSGRVSSVGVRLGQRVAKGQILATLSASSELGQLNQAYGALKAAQAALARTIEGATTEEVRVAEVTLENAKSSLASVQKTQDLLVRNAQAALFSNDLEAVSQFGASSNAPTISGTYTGMVENEYTISVYGTGTGNYASISSAITGESLSVPVASFGYQPLGKYGLYVQFPSSVAANDTWKVKIPNTASASHSTYLAALRNAEETRDSAVETAKGNVAAAEASLALKKAAARPSDIAAKEADVLIAEGRVQQAQGAYEDKVIRAPIDGVITKVDVSVGENVDAKKPIIILQDKGELFLEANINEADIAEVKEGQLATFTVDTLASSEVFTAEISHIDQSPTKEGSIVNYKIRAAITSGKDKIQTGATANISILINEKPNVLVVPTRTIRKDEAGNPFVLLVTSEKRAKTTERQISLGMNGDGALTEVLSGLSEGEKVLFRIK